MINYSIIHNSTVYYETVGYKRIESPWTVSKEINSITKPVGVEEYEILHNGKCLVASGEQSFLYLYVKGFLPKGKFQTVTPCFRSDHFGPYHTKYFLKNELIDTENANRAGLDRIIGSAFNFMANYFGSENLRVVKTDIGYDICYGEIELGSYGIRECEFLKWVYGTGLAEPRFSTVLNRIKINGIS